MTWGKDRKKSCDVNVLQSSRSCRGYCKRGILSPDLLENIHQNSSQLHTVRTPAENGFEGGNGVMRWEGEAGGVGQSNSDQDCVQ